MARKSVASPNEAPLEVQYVYWGRTETKALIVGLVTGGIYGALNLPIPAPGVLGGNLAILFTFIGLVLVGMLRGELALGKPPKTTEVAPHHGNEGKTEMSDPE